MMENFSLKLHINSLIFKSFLVKYEWDIKSYPFNIVLADNIVTGLRLEVSFFWCHEKSAAYSATPYIIEPFKLKKTQANACVSPKYRRC